MTDRKQKRLMPPDWDEAVDGEWDDEYASEQALAEGADVELVVNFLNRRLDPEQLDQVRRRLDDDPAFRDLAAPLILTWQMPKYLERHPRPAGELERDWDEFTKRAGFAHQQRKSRWRRLWLLGIALFVIGASAFTLRAPIREWYVTARYFETLPYQEGWIPLGDSIFVQPDSEATVRVSRVLLDGERHVILDGHAQFRVLVRDSLTPTPRWSGLLLRTRGGLVQAREAQFTVVTRGDTTDVVVHRPSVRRFEYFIPIPTGVQIGRAASAEPIAVGEMARGRLVRGQDPVRLSQEP